MTNDSGSAPGKYVHDYQACAHCGTVRPASQLDAGECVDQGWCKAIVYLARKEQARLQQKEGDNE